MSHGMDGLISEHPFAELIIEILEKRFSGALRVERKRVKAVVYFDSGDLIYATSNLKNLRLTEYLRKRGVPVEKMLGMDSFSDFAAAASLLARGMVTQSTLDEATTEQVTDVARILLLWTDGQWSFEERARLTEPVRAHLKLRQLVLDASRRMDLKFPAARLSDLNEIISLGPSEGTELSLVASEGFLLSRVEGVIADDQLVMLSGMREPDALRTIYGLVLSGLLVRQSWPHALKAGAARKAEPKTEVAEPKPAPPKPQDTEADLNEFLERLARAANHYEVLDIPTTSGAREIKNAYYALARRFHPDRFHELARGALHARLESAFARITQAHEMLSDPATKANYDAKIAAMKNVSQLSSMDASSSSDTQTSGEGGANTQLAEQRFQEGVAAMQMSEMNTATAALSAAARLAPNQARYRAYYGRALAAHPQTKRLAEAELQAAVKLDPANASYRVMLATLYRDLGFWRRAINELERALSLDSKNVEARRMLQSLETKK